MIEFGCYLSSLTAIFSRWRCFLKSPISTLSLSFIATSFCICWTCSSSVFHCIWLPFATFTGSSDLCLMVDDVVGFGGIGGFLETILTSFTGFIVIISISRFVMFVLAFKNLSVQSSLGNETLNSIRFLGIALMYFDSFTSRSLVQIMTFILLLIVLETIEARN